MEEKARGDRRIGGMADAKLLDARLKMLREIATEVLDEIKEEQAAAARQKEAEDRRKEELRIANAKKQEEMERVRREALAAAAKPSQQPAHKTLPGMVAEEVGSAKEESAALIATHEQMGRALTGQVRLRLRLRLRLRVRPLQA